MDMPRGELLDGLISEGRNETIGAEEWYRKSLTKDSASFVGSLLFFHQFIHCSHSFSNML